MHSTSPAVESLSSATIEKLILDTLNSAEKLHTEPNKEASEAKQVISPHKLETRSVESASSGALRRLISDILANSRNYAMDESAEILQPKISSNTESQISADTAKTSRTDSKETSSNTAASDDDGQKLTSQLLLSIGQDERDNYGKEGNLSTCSSTSKQVLDSSSSEVTGCIISEILQQLFQKRIPGHSLKSEAGKTDEVDRNSTDSHTPNSIHHGVVNSLAKTQASDIEIKDDISQVISEEMKMTDRESLESVTSDILIQYIISDMLKALRLDRLDSNSSSSSVASEVMVRTAESVSFDNLKRTIIEILERISKSDIKRETGHQRASSTVLLNQIDSEPSTKHGRIKCIL